MPSKLGFIIDLGLVCLRNCQYRYAVCGYHMVGKLYS